MTATTVELRWDAVPGAVRYRIERTRSAGIGGARPFVVEGTSHVDERLELGTLYTYRIKSVGGRGVASSDWSPALAVRTVLGVPANLEIVGKTSTTLRLTWDRVPGAHLYELRRRQGTRITLIPVGSGTSYTDEGLTRQTRYFYEVRAIRGTVRSRWSAPPATAKTKR